MAVGLPAAGAFGTLKALGPRPVGVRLGYDTPMGQRSRTESVAAVMAAFFTHRKWTQAELARAVDLRPAALRAVLQDLCANGIPLESQKDHPHVYWRMPRDWYPGGVLFRADLVPELFRHLSRLPSGKARDRLLAVVMEQLPARGKLTATAPIVSRRSSETEEEYLPIIEDAAARKVPVWMKYLTASRGGKLGERHASVHLVDVGPPARFVATCHRNHDLRWFRVDSVLRARLDGSEKFRACAPEELAAYRAASLDGFKGEGAPQTCSFFVREPESAWVSNNLLDGMRAETLHGGIRVSIETSAILRLARFVVALGEAARPETTALARTVAELARGALDQAEALLRDDREPGPSPAEPLASAVQPRSGS
jgi:predicted DNA-binding transcriptional regulator YafY